MQSPNAIERSQKKLYLALQSELSLFEKKKPRELIAYERSFHSSLSSRSHAAEKSSLLNAVKRAQVILVGDFHPFRQSQKGFLRLLNEAISDCSRPVIALECLQQTHQRALEKFLAGYITIEELRDEVDFERHWPFCWENYREILVFAKQHKLAALALNVVPAKGSRTPLRDRDFAAAQKISLELKKKPDSKFFVLYGELHLGRSHLPADLRSQLGSKGRVVCVHQNLTELYWRSRPGENGLRPEILKLGVNEFCILNSVPWVKLRSYLEWLEGSGPSDEWNDETEIADVVHHYARLLADSLGLSSQIREEIEIIGPDRLVAGGIPKTLGKVSASDLLFARHSLRYQRTGYLPNRGALLLPSASTNALSDAASFLLWHSKNRHSSKISRPNLQDCIAHFFLGYVGSKFLNPKRKCNEVRDLEEWSKKNRKKMSRKSSNVPLLALKLLRPYLKGKNVPLSHQKKASTTREVEACRLAGYVLGERFFPVLLKKPARLSLIRAWYECESTPAKHKLLKKTSVEIGRSPLRPISKKDRF